MRYLILGSLVLPASAWAQPDPSAAEVKLSGSETPGSESPPSAEPGGPPRDGFSYGLALGVGSMELDCDVCQDRGGGAFFSMAVRGGWWVSPRQVVVSAELGWSLISFGDERLEDSDEELELTLGGLAQVYLSRLFWVGGGGGLAVYSPPVEAPTGSGPGFIAAAGVHTGVIEIHVRGVVGVYGDYGTRSVILMLGGSS